MKKLLLKGIKNEKVLVAALCAIVFQISFCVLVSLFSSIGHLLLALRLVCAMVISWNRIQEVITIKFK